MFAHPVLLFALLIACRTPGTPVPCKAGLDWTPRMGGSATTGSNDTRPRAPGKPLFTPFPGGSPFRSPLPLRDPGAGSTNTSFYTPHASFVHPLLFLFVLCLCVTLPQSTHTYGQSRILFSFLPNPSMHENPRYFAPLPTHSDLCLSADRCTVIACILAYTVHHSPTFTRLSPPTHATHGMRVSPNPWQ